MAYAWWASLASLSGMSVSGGRLRSFPAIISSMERREVVIERAPSLRLLSRSRWRSFKLPEVRWWANDLAPVWGLVAQGWAVREVDVRMKSAPLLPSQREPALRELLSCGAGCELIERYGEPGRGRTIFRLELSASHA